MAQLDVLEDEEITTSLGNKFQGGIFFFPKSHLILQFEAVPAHALRKFPFRADFIVGTIGMAKIEGKSFGTNPSLTTWKIPGSSQAIPALGQLQPSRGCPKNRAHLGENIWQNSTTRR